MDSSIPVPYKLTFQTPLSSQSIHVGDPPYSYPIPSITNNAAKSIKVEVDMGTAMQLGTYLDTTSTFTFQAETDKQIGPYQINVTLSQNGNPFALTSTYSFVLIVLPKPSEEAADNTTDNSTINVMEILAAKNVTKAVVKPPVGNRKVYIAPLIDTSTVSTSLTANI